MDADVGKEKSDLSYSTSFHSLSALISVFCGQGVRNRTRNYPQITQMDADMGRENSDLSYSAGSHFFSALICVFCGQIPFTRILPGLFPGVCKALVFELRIMPKIDKEGDFIPGRTEVIDYLGAVFIGQHGNGLEFHNDFLKADKVWFVVLIEWMAFVFQVQWFLGDERNALQAKFKLHAFLIHGLQKTAALNFVNLKASANDAVSFVFV
jgi:hypothetical protein